MEHDQEVEETENVVQVSNICITALTRREPNALAPQRPQQSLTQLLFRFTLELKAGKLTSVVTGVVLIAC